MCTRPTASLVSLAQSLSEDQWRHMVTQKGMPYTQLTPDQRALVRAWVECWRATPGGQEACGRWPDILKYERGFEQARVHFEISGNFWLMFISEYSSPPGHENRVGQVM